MAAHSRMNSPHVSEPALRGAAERSYEYLRTMENRNVAPNAAAVAALERFREPFPENPSEPADVVTLLDKFGAPATVATTGGRYFGFVIGGTLPASLAASWLANTWDQNAALRVMSPVAAELEEVVLKWVCEALGLPSDCDGGLVTCATTANFTALATARHALLSRMGWNAADDGMFGAPPIQVVVGQEVHASVLKALNLVGFGSKRVTVVEADEQGRIRADKLPRLDKSTIVCIQAGNVNTGSFDPAREICLRAHEQSAWVHVDGAFGLWAAASPKYKHLVAGFELADSWAMDAHKWPNINYDSGIVLVRDAMALRAAMTISAAYLQPGTQREPMHHTPEASRRARGIELWAGLKSLGRTGLANLIERTCAHAQRFAAGLREAGFEILNDVVINQVLVSFGPPERTLEVMRRIQEEGTCWCSGTVWQGRTAMRISVSSWATTSADVEKSLAAMLRIARETGA
ncbi:MAG TPA: aminotransferase class V-fold PLP-dependent enzyme [Candidatus Sulfotelmatobacter sp.]|nr:aminotransferase class V-fold PLP-dependent enzyme [Candidatus Sulfotelmatobacter sp.]